MKGRMLIITLASLASFAPATAQPSVEIPAAGHVLWNDLVVGMPKSEVKRRYPNWKSVIGPDCHIAVTARFHRDGLVTVLLLQNVQKRPDCFEFVRDDLEKTLGTPEPIVIRSAGSYGTTMWSYSSTDRKWVKDGVTIVLASTPGGYNLIYAVAPLKF